MSATALKTLREQITAKRERLKVILDKTRESDTALPPEEEGEYKSLLTEINDDLAPKLDRLIEEDRVRRENDAELKTLHAVRRPGHVVPAGTMGDDGAELTRRGHEIKTIGELFVEHESYKSFQTDKRVLVDMADFDIKTLFQTSAGWSPFVERRPGWVASAQQPPRIVDLIPTYQTTQGSIKWMLETTHTNAATEIGEAGTYPESAFALTEQTTAVKKIAVTIPATDEQLDDEPAARDYLNNRLTLNLRQRLDLQLAAGDGNGANLRGLINIVGHQTQAKGADPDFDAILKAVVKVQAVGFAEPSAVLMHPTDWQNLRLIRANGLYVLGYPGDAVAPRIWGLPVVTTTYVTQSNAIVADFANYTELWYRKGISFDVTNSHASEFVTGTQRLRAQMRLAFVCTRPTAICLATGLAGS